MAKDISIKNPSEQRLNQAGVDTGSFYWLRCWDRRIWTRRGYRRRYFYTFMHSNGQTLATSQPIDNRGDRDDVVNGLLENRIHMAIWQNADGSEVTRKFTVD